jgi:hypothetical protein
MRFLTNLRQKWISSLPLWNMNRLLNISDLPDEVLLHIQQQIIPEIQLPRNPESTYLNRYTPFAKALRCVCHRWKELVDLCSNYHTRITTAVIQLNPEGDFVATDRKRFALILNSRGVY